MNKIYKIKEWYSIDDAARRLTETLGEQVIYEDVLQLVIENQVPLSWYIRHKPAVQVAPRINILTMQDMGVLAEEKNVKAAFDKSDRLYSRALQEQSENVTYLEGAFHLETQMMGWVRDWLLSLITETGGDLMCMDGFLVRDMNKNLWRILERFPSKIGHTINEYFPSGELPEPSELGFQKVDLEAFERMLNDSVPSNKPPKELSTKERDTFLKMIIGMAVGGYSYDPAALKSSTITDIDNDLALHGVQLDQDTIRNKLKDAAQFLSGEDDAPKPNSVSPKPKSAKTS